ncbi:uncharacterized protein [Primulina eburnea]|uniref:uncharacterized protein n=1 Tax=Primulina eburnea TaxID=1245227 RepID=UPI003C6BFA27
MHDIHGTYKGCYDRLRWYCRAVKETNLGSVAECEIDIETNKFKRLFICLHACVVGFVTGCRLLIFLDGTHIKNKFKGCILLAVSKDANDDLFTIAYFVVDAENDINWEWFCYHLRSVLLSCQSIPFNEYTFFSDRHHGIIKAVNLLFTGSHYAYCLRHLVDNFVKVEHEQHIKNILESMPLARDFIVNYEPQSWANALFLGNRWGVINNNIAECWNNWVKAARYLPIVGMVDHIRVQIMNMMHQRRESTAMMVKELSPKKEKAIGSVYVESRKLRVHRSCNWRYLQINNLPCKHACAAIELKSMSFYDFCDKYFKIEMYRQSYRGIINLIPMFDINESYLDDGNEKESAGRGIKHVDTSEKSYAFE